jgi:hypothetical protein
MSKNPYPTCKGFGLRFFHAAACIRRYGRGWSQEEAGMYTRAFDNCFENFDGDAVVWQIVRDAQTDDDLARRIRLMGEKLWPQWQAIYEAPPLPGLKGGAA